MLLRGSSAYGEGAARSVRESRAPVATEVRVALWWLSGT